jgi:predicted dehydrogenase
MARSMSTRIAVVGYGYWGSKHVRVLTSLPDVKVTVVDSDPGRLADAAAHHPSTTRADNIDDVLDVVDGVVIATPPGSHARVATRSLLAGRHTLVEKPLATSVADAEALVETGERAGATLMVGHTFEYNPAVWKLKEIVQSGALGRVLYIDSARLSLGLYQRDVNVIWDLAPHDISILSYLLDEIPTATRVWALRNIGLRQADVAYLRLDFAAAACHAIVHVSWLDPQKVRRLTVVGERKMVVYNDLSDNERIRIYDVGVDPSDVGDPSGTQAMPVSYRTGDITSPYVAFREPLHVQDSHFVDCIRTGAQPKTPGERGLDVVRVLTATDAAQMSSGYSPVAGLGERPLAGQVSL